MDLSCSPLFCLLCYPLLAVLKITRLFEFFFTFIILLQSFFSFLLLIFFLCFLFKFRTSKNNSSVCSPVILLSRVSLFCSFSFFVPIPLAFYLSIFLSLSALLLCHFEFVKLSLHYLFFFSPVHLLMLAIDF